MAQPSGSRFLRCGRGRNLWRNPKAQPIGGAVLFSAADGEDDEDDKDDDDDDDDNRHYDETQSGRGHTDGAQTGWTPKCARGYARFIFSKRKH